MRKSIHCVCCGETMREDALPSHVIGTYQAETVVCENVPIERYRAIHSVGVRGGRPARNEVVQI
jgi:hypothetical protein